MTTYPIDQRLLDIATAHDATVTAWMHPAHLERDNSTGGDRELGLRFHGGGMSICWNVWCRYAGPSELAAVVAELHDSDYYYNETFTLLALQRRLPSAVTAGGSWYTQQILAYRHETGTYLPTNVWSRRLQASCSPWAEDPDIIVRISPEGNILPALTSAP